MSVPIPDLQLLPTPRRSEDIPRWGQENFRKLQDAYTSLLTTVSLQNLSIVPAGVILAWSGDIGSIPEGWVLCDGTDGTPDLRNKFIIGAGDTYAVDDTSTGVATYSLDAAVYTAGVFTVGSFDPGSGDASWTPSSYTQGTYTDNVLNEDTSMDYYALAYIMKAIPV